MRARLRAIEGENEPALDGINTSPSWTAGSSHFVRSGGHGRRLERLEDGSLHGGISAGARRSPPGICTVRTSASPGIPRARGTFPDDRDFGYDADGIEATARGERARATQGAGPNGPANSGASTHASHAYMRRADPSRRQVRHTPGREIDLPIPGSASSCSTSSPDMDAEDQGRPREGVAPAEPAPHLGCQPHAGRHRATARPDFPRRSRASRCPLARFRGIEAGLHWLALGRQLVLGQRTGARITHPRTVGRWGRRNSLIVMRTRCCEADSTQHGLRAPRYLLGTHVDTTRD